MIGTRNLESVLRSTVGMTYQNRVESELESESAISALES